VLPTLKVNDNLKIRLVPVNSGETSILRIFEIVEISGIGRTRGSFVNLFKNLVASAEVKTVFRVLANLSIS
jgi:hypothetical protein